MFLLLLSLACKEAPVDPQTGPEAPPLGMVLVEDGLTYAGTARIDLTPVITETFTDLDGDAIFDGCLDDPTCGEPFDDVDGDGQFDATFIGGFSPLRPALDIHDPVDARAVVLSQDGEYLAFVALDLVGLGSPSIGAARAQLVAEGFEGGRLLVAASHNHQGPDTMGLWGNPYNFVEPVSGIDPVYQERVIAAIEQVVRDAAAQMVPVELTVGRTLMRDRDPYFNGALFGGRNPTPRMHGMIFDGRDPVVVSDQLLVLQGRTSPDETLFTLTNWSGHPEVRGSRNNSISSDWVGVSRDVLEAHYGGMALHMPECLGGMQSALGGDLPLVDPDGRHVYQTCDAESIADPEDTACHGQAEGSTRTDEDGLSVPAWAEHDSWEFVTSHGWHIAEAAIAALTAGERISADPIRIETEPLYVPVDNVAYQLLAPMDIFDLALDDLVTDASLCADPATGCIETWTSRIALGPIGFLAVPGELLPELAWGLPEDDAQWLAEASDPSQRGAGAKYFVQHDPDCNDLDFEADCQDTTSAGDCDCAAIHAWPYTLSADPTVPPLLSLLEEEYTAVLGMTGDYLSYIIPGPDFNTAVSLLSTNAGDHYEDTVSPSPSFGPALQEAQLQIAERW